MAIGLLDLEILKFALILSVSQMAAESKNCQVTCGAVSLNDGDSIALVPTSVPSDDVMWLRNMLPNNVLSTVICQMTAPIMGGAVASKKALKLTPCPSSWNYFKGSCYGYFRDPVNFKQALGTCRQNGPANLVSIHSEAENAFVYNVWLDKEEYLGELLWIGLYKPSRNSSEPFVWSDGTPFNYTSWEPSQPDDWEGNEHCATFWRRSDADDATKPWNDVACDTVTAPFVCKVAA